MLVFSSRGRKRQEKANKKYFQHRFFFLFPRTVCGYDLCVWRTPTTARSDATPVQVNIAGIRRGRKKCAPGVGESPLVVQRERGREGRPYIKRK